jgi:type II secretory pathway pseudopilin PulG
MTILSTTKRACIAAALIAMPVTANAQNEVSEEVTEQANAVAEQAQELQQEANQLSTVAAEETQQGDDTAAAGDRREDNDDDDFDWGLLGLLGLAGLLGLKRRDDHRDVHVDTRRDADRGTRL